MIVLRDSCIALWKGRHTAVTTVLKLLESEGKLYSKDLVIAGELPSIIRGLPGIIRELLRIV